MKHDPYKPPEYYLAQEEIADLLKSHPPPVDADYFFELGRAKLYMELEEGVISERQHAERLLELDLDRAALKRKEQHGKEAPTETNQGQPDRG